MNKIIDFHTHAFPDAIANKAMAALQANCSVPAKLDGRLSSLLASMDHNGIEKSLICNIATKPSQFEPIINWCSQIRSDRIEPLPSIHPDDPLCLDRVRQVKDLGFKGIKMHPYYQEFFLDEPRMLRLFEKLLDNDLLVLMHTGFDIAFERIRRADPERILKVVEMFPGLKLVTTHLGSWEDWILVQQMLIGKKIYIEISLSLEFLDPDSVKNMLTTHPAEYLLFGTDSPWADQADAIANIKNLGLPADIQDRLFYLNAASLLEPS